jgi:oligopeptide transport system substrate-binding protein
MRIARIRRILQACLAALAFACGAATAPAAWASTSADPAKVLHIASPDIETLDPEQYDDSPSYEVTTAIFEGLYQFDYLASPTRLRPSTANAVPEITDGGRTWTVHLRPGIHFTDDPAFGGKPRELTPAHYDYSKKRWLDPNMHRAG